MIGLVVLLFWWKGRQPASTATEDNENANTPGLEMASRLPDTNAATVPEPLPIETNILPAANPPAANPEIEISGRVLLKGDAPTRDAYSAMREKAGCTETGNDDYIVGDDGGLADVFVYVSRGLETRRFPAPSGPVFVRATNCFITPHVFGVRTGQLVVIENYDRHHPFQVVFSDGRPFGWARREDGRMEDELEVVFSSSDVLSRLTCKVHPWDWGYIGALDHPFFTVTDRSGNFRLPKGLQPGSYVVTAHHPKSGYLSRSVIAAAGSKHTLLFTMRVKNEKQITPPTAPESDIIEFSSEPPAGHFARANQRPVIAGPGRPRAGESTEDTTPTLRGHIRYQGTPPPEQPITDLQNHRDCGPLQHTVPMTQFYRVSADGGLADTVVYIKQGLEGSRFPPPADPVLVDQVGCQYIPYVFALQTGQKLLVRNSDPLMHNVHIIPAVTGNRESNKAQMPKAPDLEYVFPTPERFLKIRCDVHPWMFSYAFVVDHPFISVSDTNGVFEIKNLPAGNYVLEAFHRKAGALSQTVTIGTNAAQVVNFTFGAK